MNHTNLFRRCMHGGLLLVALLAVAAQAAPGTQERAGYRVGPGDVLEVIDWNENPPQPRDLRVDPDGAISYPLVGLLNVKGMTVAEVQERLTAELRKQVKRPRLEVTLKSIQKQVAVYVLGAVERPGPYEVVQGMKVKDAIGMAGGLRKDADGAAATLKREGSDRPMPLDLERLLSGRDEGLNISLQFGDVIHVPTRLFEGPKAMMTVFVFGQVVRPGAVTLSTEARVREAITAAGGPTPLAALKKATLQRRDAKPIPVDLYAVMQQGDAASNVSLREGDVLYVPESSNRITLIGEFRSPGTYYFREDAKLSEAVALGGGPTEMADLKGATLTRDGKEIPVDLYALLKLGQLKEDRPLQEGDILTIPAVRGVTVTGQVNKPGTYPFKEGDTLSQALALAQGPTDEADLQRAVLQRGDRQIPVDLWAVLELGDKKQDLPLENGDRLNIPRAKIVTVGGAVPRPGRVPITPKCRSLMGVLALAGGPIPNVADPKKAVILRPQADGSPQRVAVDLTKGEQLARDYPFQDGDVLYVPEKRKTDWASLSTIFYMLSLGTTQILK